MKPNAPQSWKNAIAALPPCGFDTQDCPDSERIWSAVRGELTADEFGAVVDHVATCAACALAWKLAQEAPVDLDRPPARSGRRPWRAWYGVAAAAALVAAFMLVTQSRRESDRFPLSSEPEYRAPVDDVVRSELDEGAALARDHVVLRWRGPEGATYRVRVADENFHTLYRETGLTATTLAVPPEVLESLPSGGVIVWQVEAVLPDGTVRRSRTFRATLR